MNEELHFYLAPMEGLTTHVFRQAYHHYYEPMEKYFTPFLMPHEKRGFNAKELKEISPENNKGMLVVPQILSSDAAGFLHTVKKLQDLGYGEVNLNLGCPSKTVVSKFRGSGFLIKTEELDCFLWEIFEKCPLPISVKTRIGKESAEEWGPLLEIYNQYPIKELIVHPRRQVDFYKNQPNFEAFSYAAEESKNPLVYNGDIVDLASFQRVRERFPQVKSFMIGRGIVADPRLLSHLLGKDCDGHLLDFHEEVLDTYLSMYGSEKNALFKMKEMWSYMGSLVPEEKKALKQIRKTNSMQEYRLLARKLLQGK